MSEKRTSARTRRADVPCDPKSRRATPGYREGAVAHRGAAEPRAKRGRPANPPGQGKERIALRVDRDVLDGYRAQGAGRRTRMNAVLRACRDASI